MLRNNERLGRPSPLACQRALGQAMVEFAFVAMLFMALLTLIMEGGLMAASWFALGNAAREGARSGSISSATDPQILDAVNRTATTFSGSFSSVTANTTQS